MEMYFPTINNTTTQPPSSNQPQPHLPHGPPTKDIITINTVTPNATSPPTIHNEPNIHHPTPPPNWPSINTDSHNTNLTSPPAIHNNSNRPSTINDRHHHPAATHTNQQPKPTNPRKPSTNIMQYILQRRTNTLLNASSNSHIAANAPINNITQRSKPNTTTDNMNSPPSPNNANLTHDSRQHHITSTDLHSNLHSPTPTINDTNTNSNNTPPMN
jgi:hypothetical protein